MLETVEKLAVNYYWIGAVAKHLGWTERKVKTIRERLKRKGVKIPVKSTKDLTIEEIEKFKGKQFTVKEIAAKLPIGKMRTAEILEELEKEKVLAVRRAKAKNFYRKITWKLPKPAINSTVSSFGVIATFEGVENE